MQQSFQIFPAAPSYTSTSNVPVYNPSHGCAKFTSPPALSKCPAGTGNNGTPGEHSFVEREIKYNWGKRKRQKNLISINGCSGAWAPTSPRHLLTAPERGTRCSPGNVAQSRWEQWLWEQGWVEETDTGEGESWRSFGYSSEVAFVIIPSGGSGPAPGDESVFVTSGALQWGDLQRCDSLSAPAKQDGTVELISLGDHKHKETRNKKADEKCEAINNKLPSTKRAFLHLQLDLFYGLVVFFVLFFQTLQACILGKIL